MPKKRADRDKPVCRGPLLRGAEAIAFLAWQKEYVEKCLQKSLARAKMQKNSEGGEQHGKDRD